MVSVNEVTGSTLLAASPKISATVFVTVPIFSSSSRVDLSPLWSVYMYDTSFVAAKPVLRVLPQVRVTVSVVDDENFKSRLN